MLEGLCGFLGQHRGRLVTDEQLANIQLGYGVHTKAVDMGGLGIQGQSTLWETMSQDKSAREMQLRVRVALAYCQGFGSQHPHSSRGPQASVNSSSRESDVLLWLLWVLHTLDPLVMSQIHTHKIRIELNKQIPLTEQLPE